MVALQSLLRAVMLLHASGPGFFHYPLGLVAKGFR